MGIPAANDKIITPKKHSSLIKKESIKNGKWKVQFDAIVIGSGAGGSVAAAELSHKGWKVLLIEEGSYFTPANFNSDEFLSHARLYRDAGFIVSEDQTINILQGRSIGGSTTVNWQTSLFPPDYVTTEWKNRFGWEGYAKNEMLPYINEVHERLGVHEVPNPLINPNNSVLLNGGKKIGLNPEVLLNNNRGCIGLGRCGLGCPINAKQSAFLTWIPDAINSGATVISNMRVVKIKDGNVKTVIAEFTPDAYEQSPKEIIESMEATAPVVIVSAGAIEGPALLQRSGLGNKWVGRNLKLHPTSTVFGKFKNEIKMYEGPPQSIVIKNGHNLDNTGYGYWLEAAPYRPSLASSLVPFKGKTQFEVMKDFNHYNAGIVLVRDGADGETNANVEWSWGRRKVNFSLTPTDGQNMLRGLKSLCELTVAAGAHEVIVPFTRFEKPIAVNAQTSWDWILQESFAPGFMAVGSAHPHGSIQAASEEKLGAVDMNFELYGHNNIFVMDASLFPTGLSVNPQITTMSISLRAARKLASEKDKRTTI